VRKNYFLTDNVLYSLLVAREERAWTQKFMLRASGGGWGCCVVQISLNIPGWPKRIEGDGRALSAGAETLLAEVGTAPLLGALLSNSAGDALLYSFNGYEPNFAEAVKKNFGNRTARRTNESPRH
jgi:hypothetical protein